MNINIWPRVKHYLIWRQEVKRGYEGIARLFRKHPELLPGFVGSQQYHDDHIGSQIWEQYSSVTEQSLDLAQLLWEQGKYNRSVMSTSIFDYASRAVNWLNALILKKEEVDFEELGWTASRLLEKPNKQRAKDVIVLLRDHAFKQRNRSSIYYSSLGNAYMRLGYYDKSLLCSEQSKTLKPSFPVPYYNLAFVMIRLKLYTNACQELRDSLPLYKEEEKKEQITSAINRLNALRKSGVSPHLYSQSFTHDWAKRWSLPSSNEDFFLER